MRIRMRDGLFHTSLIASFIIAVFWKATIDPIHSANALSSNGRMTLQLKPFDARTLEVAKRYRRSLFSVDQNEVVPLNLGMGTHFAWIYVGTPPQRVSIIIDTGSGMTAFPCSGCDQCGNHTDNPFDTKLSSSLRAISCNDRTYFNCAYCEKSTDACKVQQTYMEGSSWSAKVMEDTVYLGDVASHNDNQLQKSYSTRYMFGCQNRETGLFIPQVADGIMGIHNSENDIVTKLYREKKIPTNTFTLCFAPNGGYFALGAPDTSRHAGAVTYVRINSAPYESYYAVFMTDIRVGGHSIGVDMKATGSFRYIVDSGTTNSIVPGHVGQELVNMYRNLTHMKDAFVADDCILLSQSQIEQLPSLQFVMEGVNGEQAILEISALQYLQYNDKNQSCFNILVNTRQNGGVIGASMMMNHDVIFDRSQNKVGFVPANCTFGGDTEPSSHRNNVNIPSSTNLTFPSPKQTDLPKERDSIDDEAKPEIAIVNPAINQILETETKTTNVKQQETEHERPIIVKLVGTLLVLAFFGAIILSFKLKQRKQRKDWSRVNEDEDDAVSSEDMDDDEEFGLVDAEASDRSTKKGKSLRTQRSDDITDPNETHDEDELVEVQIRDKRYMSIDQETASDQEDEIFESKTEESKYHTNVLERM